MSKKFYVEVKGLDSDDGREQLREAGVPDGSILVVTDIDRWPPLARAIREATGMDMGEVRAKVGDGRHVMARMIYAHYARKMGTSTSDIAADLDVDASNARGYIRKFEDRLFGDKAFRALNSRVSALLASDVEWTLPERPKPARRKKRGRKGTAAKKRRRLTPEEIQAIQERRQMKIDFSDANTDETGS